MEGTDKVQIVLTLNEWNTVLLMLAKQPYEVSADLIGQIRQQAMSQAQLQSNNLAAVATRASNGLGPLEPVRPAIEFPLNQDKE